VPGLRQARFGLAWRYPGLLSFAAPPLRTLAFRCESGCQPSHLQTLANALFAATRYSDDNAASTASGDSPSSLSSVSESACIAARDAGSDSSACTESLAKLLLESLSSVAATD